MPTRLTRLFRRLHPLRVSAQMRTYLKDETISGKLILGTTILSLLVVNSPLVSIFMNFWSTNLSLGIGNWTLALDLRHWLNEGLMAIFFLVVGLEIKRELVKGELQDRRTALLPIGAAIGGMLVPAFIYFFFNLNTGNIRGWGIPIATDIAFAVALLSLLGRRVPTSLKIFLLTLAIADDIGAIIVIALFYAKIINFGYLAASLVLFFGLVIFRKYLIDRLGFVILAGIVLWVTTHLSGIHASIIGAAMGLLAPIGTRRQRLSVGEKTEQFLLPISTFFILPLFAFANVGFVFTAASFTFAPTVIWGIIFGLVLGKPIGILSASWIMTRLRIASLPPGVSWRHITGVGFIAGIGFTVSIFITELAFAGNSELIGTAKVGILFASVIAAGVGILMLMIPSKFKD